MTLSNTRAPYFRRIDATGLLKLSAPFVIVVVLLTPSIWMLSVIPPLWRDVDAYLQVTRPPGAETILQYGPLYCFAARIPLYLGYAIDSIRARHSLPNPDFFIHPVLTDSGVFLLLVVQHAALCFAAFCLITVVTGIFWVRVVLAVAWAANPLLYTLAHCVGGETLSMILIVLLGAVGLRIIRHSRNPPKKEWFLVGILLWGCTLTRQINAVLAALLPLTFVLLALYRLSAVRFAGYQSTARWNRLGSKEAFKKAMVAIAIGISSIVLANASRGMLCYAVKIPYHSVAGFAFVDRLKFLAAVPGEQRDQLLAKASKNANSGDVKNLISLLRNELTGSWDASAFKNRARASFRKWR